MDWGDISELCGRELRALRSQGPALHTLFENLADVPDTIIRLEDDTQFGVDAAVREFAEHRRWPTLQPGERAMLTLRLEFAAHLANLLYEQPGSVDDSPDQQDDEYRLGWLMLFAWDVTGFPRLQETIFRVFGRRLPDNAP
jgi:hypothetical protein